MILTHDEILKRISMGDLKIEPFEENQVGPASIDLTLDNYFRVFKPNQSVIDVNEVMPVRDDAVTESIEVEDKLLLQPGQFVLGVTKEKITMPNNLSGRLEGRSRFARLGLAVHITAGFIQPGVSNKQVLEIANVGPVPLALHPGTRIAQLILEETLGTAEYKGVFMKQEKP